MQPINNLYVSAPKGIRRGETSLLAYTYIIVIGQDLHVADIVLPMRVIDNLPIGLHHPIGSQSQV